MTDVNEDIKESTEASDGAAGGASAPEQVPSDFLIDVDDIIQSQVNAEPGEAENTQESEDDDKGGPDNDKAGEKEGDTKPDDSGHEDDDEIDGDKHPRFKKRIDKLRGQSSEYLERALKAEGKLEGFTEARPEGNKPGTPQEEVSPMADVKFDDIMTLSDEDIQDQLAEKPKAFLANFANQVASETYQIVRQAFDADKEKEQQATTRKSVQGTYDQYSKNNPDFNTMWDSGDIKAFMDENPGHNAISAHQMLTASKSNDGVQKMIDDAVLKAKKETEATVLKNVKAKRNASVISGGPSSGGKVNDVSQELKYPKKFGGATAVLAGRLAERRRTANAM